MTSFIPDDESVPFSDGDIRNYLPNALILQYSDLQKYPTLADVLPDVKSYCILLYEDSPNRGHWTCISKPEEGVAEYFDSYGGYIDEPLTWISESKQEVLGQGEPYLSMLFRKAPEEVVYSKVDYQKESPTVSSCGRWCVLRILKMIAGYDLGDFYKFIKKERKKLGKGADFDDVVMDLIP